MKITESYLRKIIREELSLFNLFSRKKQSSDSDSEDENWTPQGRRKRNDEWDIPDTRSSERRFDFPSLADLQGNDLDGNMVRVFLWLYMNGFQYAGYRDTDDYFAELWFFADEKSMNRQTKYPTHVVLRFKGGRARNGVGKLVEIYKRPGLRTLKKKCYACRTRAYLSFIDGYKLPWMGTDIK